ncbi:MAG TPA: hypothetical protein VMB47_18220, partial [Candidatus Aquilonibacter sp.]|nr:hypothetical protein [Candidatus Aquilonibacter sp.]
MTSMRIPSKAATFLLASASLACFSLFAAARQESWMAPMDKDFPTVGGNLANQRYSALTQITPGNLSKLG